MVNQPKTTIPLNQIIKQPNQAVILKHAMHHQDCISESLLYIVCVVICYQPSVVSIEQNGLSSSVLPSLLLEHKPAHYFVQIYDGFAIGFQGCGL